MIDPRPSAAALDVAEQLRSEQVANAASRGEDVLRSIRRGERRERRVDVAFADIAEVEHALHADHPIAGELIVATDLGATDHVAAIAGAEIIRRNDCNAVYEADAALIGPGPATTDVAADVTAGPVVGHDGRHHRRLGVGPRSQVGGRDRADAAKTKYDTCSKSQLKMTTHVNLLTSNGNSIQPI